MLARELLRLRTFFLGTFVWLERISYVVSMKDFFAIFSVMGSVMRTEVAQSVGLRLAKA